MKFMIVLGITLLVVSLGESANLDEHCKLWYE